jgi:hypothetical protein
MTDIKFITVAAGILDEVEGTYYSLPASYSRIEDAVERFNELQESGRHEAGVLIRQTGETWDELSGFGEDYLVARDPWGGFDLVLGATLGM